MRLNRREAKRVYCRADTVATVAYSPDPSLKGESEACAGIDIAENGMRIRHKRFLNVRTRCRFSIAVRNPSQTFHCEGVIRWTREL